MNAIEELSVLFYKTYAWEKCFLSGYKDKCFWLIIIRTTKVEQKITETVDIIWAVCYNMHVINLINM
jgi:hypothetical protein